MSNPNENKSYNREVRQESYNDANGHNHTHVTRTNETVNNVSNPNTYRDGYIDGQVTENRYQQEVLAERDNENAGRGLLIGILLTSLAALTAGAIWYYNQRDDVDPVQTIVVPNSQPAPSPSPEAKQNTTVIEKTRDVPVPVVVPQQQAPAPQAPAPAPDINISVPNSVTQPPATKEAPASEPAPSPSESQSNSTDTQSTQSSTDTTTPAESTSSQADTTSGSTPTGGGSTGDAAQ